MNKIGILYICTGDYWKFWENFYKSSEELFLTNEEKHYFLFTDNRELLNINNERIHSFFQEKMDWPYPTLYRYKTFIKYKTVFQDMDYLIFCNANLLFNEKISRNDLFANKELFATLHPGFFDKKPQKFTYETNIKSLAYTEKKVDSIYVCGGFNGGIKNDFLKMAEILDDNIDKDFSESIIAIWHDESHINNYVQNNKEKFNILSPSFCYPQHYSIDINKKIIVQDKEKIISIKHKGVFYNIRFLIIKMLKKMFRHRR
ncbi:glycosyl transferase [Sulfurospirillum deleyianum]|uniref:Putative glycosyltransferase n=1 Tax=Sulfurospirillum deleyianum (strain ATCC 51133 / DSM 6946 / 5175) TaxID=525898 RepID=D1B3X0_SULD5|nr:glycosyl transferase [Sulfurospirillum deleyianum]ACZ12790.1 putative glycosyltransferase [Sulfurospirillum deleyianum DSM 6946]